MTLHKRILPGKWRDKLLYFYEVVHKTLELSIQGDLSPHGFQDKVKIHVSVPTHQTFLGKHSQSNVIVIF